ncbi:MAG: hypothetical protein RR396_00030 [Clostridiales bacterium]
MPGLGDQWLYSRIQAMLAAGQLIEVAPAKDGHPYLAVMRYDH